MGGLWHRGLVRQLAHYASLKHLRLGVGLEAVERAHRAKDLLRGDAMSVVTSVNTVGSKKVPL